MNRITTLKEGNHEDLKEFANLNNAPPNEAQNVPGTKQNNFSKVNSAGDIAVYFKNIERKIVKRIEGYDVVYGCVAWLTSKEILNALEAKECLIIVQEEDFLRPDTGFDGDITSFKNKLQKLYQALEGKKISLGALGIKERGQIDSGVRRLGYLNTKKAPAFPRMHNKFIVGLQYDKNKNLIAHEVITGSYNYTENSKNSLENIVCIKDPEIVEAYFNQFGELATMSIPLDWKVDWSPLIGEIRYGS